MKPMTSFLPLFAFSMGCKAVQLSKTSFTGQSCRARRSFARLSPILMMPEGPEVRIVVDHLGDGIGRRLVDIQFLSGRYVRHGRPNGFEEFANTMTPVTFQPQLSSPEATDTVKEWTTKGKFIYMILDNGKKAPKNDANFARSIWITLGMTGQFVNEKIHQQDPRFARWYLELLDLESHTTHKVYYHDQRNFGTLKFCLSKQELENKLKSLGPDVLSLETTEEDFLERMEASRDDLNICKFLMDQSKLAGVGNYILAESLYRCMVDPFASLNELDEKMRRKLFQEIQAVSQESYKSRGLTRSDGGTFQNVEGDRGQFEFQLQCYGRKTCAQGDPVIKDTKGPHKRTIWYTEKQLFKPLSERRFSMVLTEAAESAADEPQNDSQRDIKDLASALREPGWKSALSGAFSSESFANLQAFLEEEVAAGATIYPPRDDVFSAFNLCPFEKTKVVIVGQDPYHGPGQGHGLAFSVRRDVQTIDDLAIKQYHGNLEHWAKQGVLLLNTVLTVRRGNANSHAKKGWEDFTDEVIRVLNEEKEDGLVFLLWGNPAKKKAAGVDEDRHCLIQTSHPSPLGATKTKSPFLGSRCFSRANKALEEMGKTPVDWDIL
eukprot:scaffold2322_cov135-Cylindrotheca_fusiformis.AAC.27